MTDFDHALLDFEWDLHGKIYSALIQRKEGMTPADVAAAERARADRAEAKSACGHPASSMLRSAETGEPLYCELCDERSRRRDAEKMEDKYKADRDRLRVEAANLERAAQSLMDAINLEFDAENPDEARDEGREPVPLEAAMEARSGAWLALVRAIHYSKKARGAT